LAIVYGASHQSVKDRFLTKIAAISSDHRLPLMLGGDFNILSFFSEKNKEMNKSKWYVWGTIYLDK
jgi:GMP synthase PP-ATPase subunit